MRDNLICIAAGLVSVLVSGCCSPDLVRSATANEWVNGVTGAFRQGDDRYVTLSVMRKIGYDGAPAERHHYVRLRPDASLRRFRAPMPDRITGTPIPLIPVRAREEAVAMADRGCVFWFKDTVWHYLPGTGPRDVEYHFLYRVEDGMADAVMRDGREFIPLGQYPRLVALMPLALTYDILTFPFWLLVKDFDKAFSG